MCGIAAIWGPGANKGQTSKTMLSAIKHRGHSLYELKEFQRCALGANRLEIVDRSNGRQPASNEDASIQAVFNGEIFNHRQLKAELEGQGHRYRTDCDTETLVHLYEEYGPAMLQKLDSEMFVFAIYDSKKDSLMVARDRWGVKPLYWAQDAAGAYYFGSEIKELCSLPEIAAVKLFPHGHYFMDGKLAAYYSPGNAPKIKISEEEAAKTLRGLIDEAVRKRVDTDLPIGVFLSGGLDSTSILATARKYHSNITAIIVGQPDSEDVKFAKRYCEQTSTPFIVRSPPSEQEMFKNIEKTVAICESFEPNVVRQSAVSYYIAKAAKEADLRIVLCGEGADELFMGYPEFKDLGPSMASDRQNIFLKDLHRTQFQRVDRTSMHFTIEVRVPFFDQKIVELARSLKPNLLIKERNGQLVEKYVLRKAMEDRLPPEICWRKKVVLSEGAGYGGNQPGGLFEALASAQVSDGQLAVLQEQFPQWNIRTKEEAYYFSIFHKLGYAKAGFNAHRVTANRITSVAQKPVIPIDQQLFDILTSSKFCRFEAKKAVQMQQLIAQSVKRKKPIEMFMLWGVWKKNSVNGPEHEALGIIESMQQQVRAVYPPGFRLTIVMADTHAAINLLDTMSIYGYDSYMGSFQRYAQSKGYNVVRLSDVLASQRVIQKTVDAQMALIEQSDYWPILVASAEKYYEGSDKQEGACAYVKKRLEEKPGIEKAFAGRIFLTYNGPRYDVLAPNVPTIYQIPNYRRTNEKPWFSVD